MQYWTENELDKVDLDEPVLFEPVAVDQLEETIVEQPSLRIGKQFIELLSEAMQAKLVISSCCPYYLQPDRFTS